MNSSEQPPPGAREPDADPQGQSDTDDDSPSATLRALLRRPPPPPSDLLRGVQQKLRVRSEGKFYADGWSTREENPRSTYLITALVMVAIVLLLSLALRPYGITPAPNGAPSPSPAGHAS